MFRYRAFLVKVARLSSGLGSPASSETVCLDIQLGRHGPKGTEDMKAESAT